MASFSLTNLSLEGDGVIENLFHFLWTKDELDQGPCINIPDTIIYKFRQPAYWYFTAKNGQVKRKSRYNLSNIRIEEAFTRKQVGSDIIAYYLSTNSQGVTTIEYFDRAGFRDFLYNREKVDNGMVQLFVEPKSTKNIMVRAVWSPKIVLLERRENVHHLSDTKFSLYERAVTFEGPEHLSRASPIRGSLLPISVQDVCKNVVEHVAEVSFRKCNISRMALNFKIDGEDRLWLCWCTSLRLEQSAPLGSPLGLSTLSSLSAFRSKQPSKEGPISLLPHCQVPENVQRAFAKSGTKTRAEPTSPSAPAQGLPSNSGVSQSIQVAECKSCCEKVLNDRFYKVNYKTLVAHYDQFMSVLIANNNGRAQMEWPPNSKVIDAVGKVGLAPLERLRELIRNTKDKSKVVIASEDLEIPPIIRAAHPNLTASDYRRYKKDPMFLWKVASVCEECYLVFAQISTVGGTSVSEGLSLSLPSEETERIREKSEKAVDEHIARASHARTERKQKRQKEREMYQRIYSKRSSEKESFSNAMKKFTSPDLPPRIDDTNIGTLSMTRSEAVLRTQNEYQMESSATAEESKFNMDDLDEQFRKELQEREDNFFRDLYKNPNLKNGHPLSHLIVTQAKLSMAESALTGNSPKHKMNSTNNNSRVNSPKARPRVMDEVTSAEYQASPYAKTQVVRVKPGSASRKKRLSPRSRLTEGNFNPIGSAGESIVSGGYQQQRPKSSESVSASRHREFLLNTLQNVQNELRNPLPLHHAVGLDGVADMMGERMSSGDNFEEAWKLREKSLAATPSDLGRILRSSIHVGGEKLMAAVDIHGTDMLVSVFNPKLGVSQRLELPMSVVIENAPQGLSSHEDLARYILGTLEEDVGSDLFPDATCVKFPDEFHTLS